MKKLILFLALLLGVSSAWAECPVKSPCDCNSDSLAQTEVPCEKPEMNTGCGCNCDCSAYYDKKYAGMTKNLCLTNEQKCKADSLFEKFKADMNMLCKRMNEQQRELCRLIKSCACMTDINNQKREIRCTKKEVKNTIMTFCKDFNCLLDDCQKKEHKKVIKEDKRETKLLLKNCPCFFWMCICD